MGNEKTKVIHVDTEHSWRGGQRQAVYLLEGMLRQGYDTCMVCQPGSAMETYCSDHNLPYKAIRFMHEFDYKAGKELSQFAKSFKADILQLHTGHAVSWGLWAELLQHRLKLVATRRVDFSIKKNFLSPFKYKSKNLNHIVCISENIRQIMIKDGIDKSKLSLIHSGIDTHRFDNVEVPMDFRSKWAIPQDALLIGTIAAFAGHKDYPNFIKAAAQVLEQRKDVYFMAVGDGFLLEEMKQLADSYKVTDRIVFTGFQHNVGEFLKAFDLFVLASKMEGLGTSVLDAMSVGLPIVCTEAGGIPEMINNGSNGILVPIHESGLLSKAILDLLNNPNYRKILGDNALISVTDFDISNTVNQYIKLYSELLYD